MNAALRVAYGTAGQIARAAAALAPAGDTKWRRTLSARRGIRARYAAWTPHRDIARALLWMHAPSVGEGLQARAVLDLARTRRPDLQRAYTFFSPSAEPFARSLGADFCDYLPFDTAGDADAALRALRPSALVFSKTDIWPVLAERAVRRGVHLGMISATVSPISSRRHGIARELLRDAYSRLELVGAVSEGDAERLIDLGARPESVSVTGDTRYDQANQRASTVDRGGPLLSSLEAARPTIVAGSTWPADEAVLLRAWATIRGEARDARLIIAPHEPTPEHLQSIERWARESQLFGARLSTPAAGAADVIIVDRMGVLGDLYALADVAFVGGGFHAAGLHSVLEPAAFGVPVVFGPRHQGSRDAGLLLEEGGARTAATVDELIEVIAHWLGDAMAMRQAGADARAVVERGLGAADRSFALVMQLLEAQKREPEIAGGVSP